MFLRVFITFFFNLLSNLSLKAVIRAMFYILFFSIYFLINLIRIEVFNSVNLCIYRMIIITNTCLLNCKRFCYIFLFSFHFCDFLGRKFVSRYTKSLLQRYVCMFIQTQLLFFWKLVVCLKILRNVNEAPNNRVGWNRLLL